MYFTFSYLPLNKCCANLEKYIIALQQSLNARGIDVGGADGILGPATREGIRQFQLSQDMVADGFPSLSVMEALGVTITPNSWAVVFQSAWKQQKSGTWTSVNSCTLLL